MLTLLHIDTEGYDLKVLKSMDFAEVSAFWIMIEHGHLTVDDRTEMVSVLDSFNY